MAANPASRPFPSHASDAPDLTGVRSRDALPERLPESLPKTSRGLSFDKANRSSVRALSLVTPAPVDDYVEEYDDEEDVETTLFRRNGPSPEQSRLRARKAPSQKSAARPSMRRSLVRPPAPPPPPESAPASLSESPFFAPPLPVPSLGAYVPTSQRGMRRSAAPTPLPAHVHLPTTRWPRSRRASTQSHRRMRGAAMLFIAAVIGATVGWLVTPHVYGEGSPDAAPASLQP